MHRLKTFLRRAAGRARVSPHPVFRWTEEFARRVYRLLGRVLPGLHLGWMSTLRGARWDGDDLVLHGWSYVRGTNHGGSPQHEVFLKRRFVPVRFGFPVARAEVQHVPDLDVLGRATRARVNHEGATWEARFPASVLAALPSRRWQLWATVRGGRRLSWGRVRGVYAYGTPSTAGLRPIGGRLVGPESVPGGGGAYIVSKPLGVAALSVTAAGREVTIAVPADVEQRVTPAVLRGDGQEDVSLELRRDGDRILLTGRVPRGNVVDDEVTGVRYPPRWIACGGWDCEAITLLPDVAGHRPDDVSKLIVRPAPDRSVQVVDVPHYVEVDAVVRDGDVLRITGSLVGDPGQFSLVLAARRAEIPVMIESLTDDGAFVATAPLRISTWGSEPMPPARGGYALEGHHTLVDGSTARFATFVSEAFLATVPSVDSRDDLRMRFELNRQPQLLIRFTRPRRPDEYGAYNQHGLFDHYAIDLDEPLDAVYFESFFGRSATCNPRAIDAEVARRFPDLPRYWSVDDCSVAVPEGATPLIIGSRGWWHVRESSRWIVTNEWLRGRYVKKDFQTVLQTWHGSMYKRIGIDRGRGGHTDRARAERANWDLFISQNADTTPIIQQAYEFEGPEASNVIEVGYPRNDELTRIDPGRVAEIRRRVGIPHGTCVAMYAPTWREASQEVELLDLVALAEAVGPGFTFLQRGHVRTLGKGATVHSGAVIDVSTYPQINELYMVADLLITDYSSMMFDYSVMRRPMLFYTPDIEEYTDPRVRGVYFDLEELAPGPVVRTVSEVVDLLKAMDEWVPTYDDKYEAWQKRFNHLDDGDASARAVDALFAFDPAKRTLAVRRQLFDPSADEES